MQSLNNSLNSSATLVSKLTLLGFDCKSTKIPIDKNTFNTKNSCIKAFEAVTYFLFNLLDKTKSNKLFKDVWPIRSTKDSLVYRTKVFTWLTELRGNTSLKRISVRKSHIIDCKGENVGKIVMALTTFVMQHMNIKMKQDQTPCKDVKKEVLTKENTTTADYIKKDRLELVPLRCSSNESKKSQVELAPSKKRANDDSTSLAPNTNKKQKVQPRYTRAIPSTATVKITAHKVYDLQVNRDEQAHGCSNEEREEKVDLSEEQILTLKRWDEEYEREERINQELLVEGTTAKIILRYRRSMEAQMKLESMKEEGLKIERAEQDRAEQDRKEEKKAELERAEQKRIEKKRLEEERRVEEEKKKKRQERKIVKKKEKELRERVERARASLAIQNRKEEERRTRKRKR